MHENSEHKHAAGPAEGAGRSFAYRIVRATFVVLFFWLFWKFGGFLLNALVGRLYRAGAESDAYFFAAQVVVYGLIYGSALRVAVPAFTPIFIEERNRRGERAAWDFASTVLNLTLLGCAVMMLVVYACVGPITETLVRGFGGEARLLGIRLLRLILPGAALMLLYLPLRSILNSYKVFSYPSAAEAVQKLLWAVGMFVTYRYLHLGLRAVAMGFLVGSVGMVAVSAFGMRGHLGLYRPSFPSLTARRFWTEAAISAVFLFGTAAAFRVGDVLLPEGSQYRDLVRVTLALCAASAFAGQLWLRARKRTGTMGRLAAVAAPLILSTAFATYRDLVTFYFQSFTARGVFSDIEYARRIAFVPPTMVAYALSVAMFPYLCELASKKDHAALGSVVEEALRMLALGFVPLTVATVVLADPVTRLVLDRGDWTAVHLYYAALALALLALGLIVYAWEYVVMQGFFSLQRMWAPSLVGIAATFFQFAFLAVPIYLLGFDYPVHIFFLSVLAYALSRFFKNGILLVMLRRRLPVLPLGSTLLFAGKLAVLSAAVGAAMWGALTLVRRQAPYEQYRQHKVVVDSFETGPETWFSLNARDVGIVQAPAGGQGQAVMMRYPCGRPTRCSLYRETTGLRTTEGMRLEFSLHSAGKMGAVAVEVERAGRLMRVLQEQVSERGWAGWQTFSCSIGGAGRIDRIHWLESEPSGGEHAFFLDDISLVDQATGRVLWSEDFDRNGWSCAGQSGPERSAGPQVTDTRAPGEAPRYALQVTAACSAQKSLTGLDLSDTGRFRCRLMSGSDGPARVVLRLVAAQRECSHAVEAAPGQWRTVDLSWSELGFEAAGQFERIQAVSIQASGGPVYVDDLSFRRPPSRKYELLKLVHCAVPTLAGLIAAALCLPLLRFEEVREVARWIKERGWRRRKERAEEPAGEPLQS